MNFTIKYIFVFIKLLSFIFISQKCEQFFRFFKITNVLLLLTVKDIKYSTY